MWEYLSQAGNLFQNFLQIKSGGSQINTIESSIKPTMDLRDFVYPPTSIGTAVTGAHKFPMHGGFGIYRVRGVIQMAGLSGISEYLFVSLVASGGSGANLDTMYFFNKQAPAVATNYDTGPIIVDVLFDCRDSGGQESPAYFTISGSQAASTLGVFSAYLVAQRVF